ncbi:MAG: phage portal protein [Oscillospiraceae bacterium]|nr:phage portal protein [Oscillospiraceae bacterium]
MFRVPSDCVMTPEFLAEYMGKHKAEVARRFLPLYDAYCNEYKILRLDKKPGWKPDNRIPVNYAKYIVDTMNGFFIGIPVKVFSDDDVVSRYVNFLDQYNDQDDNNAELSKVCSIFGCGFEMYYVDDSGQVCIAFLSPIDSFMIYDEGIVPKPLFFIRHYLDANNEEHGSWSDGRVVQHFVNRGSYRWVDEPVLHGFDGVPAVEFVENEERRGVFEDVLPIIDEYNKAISEKANDVDYFADAYLKVLGASLRQEDLDQLRRNRIINLEGDVSGITVDFLQKPNADATQENLINRLEKLIFQISMVANISDENFGTSSGIALKYKLKTMSDHAKAKERKFTSGMNRRYKLIFSNPVSSMPKDSWTTISYKFTENFPANLQEEAEIAKNLEGVVTRKTQLSVLSVVDDAKSEADAVDAELVQAPMTGAVNEQQ